MTFTSMTRPAWPPPWLVLLATDGPQDDNGELVQRLLTTHGMEQAWEDASARLDIWPADTDGLSLFILLRNARDEAQMSMDLDIGPLTATDDHEWWQDKAALVRELGAELTAIGVWEATPPLFSYATAELEQQAASAYVHPSPRPGRGDRSTRHPRLKALVRILARELTGNNFGNVDHPGNKRLNHRHLATLATAILGPELDAPAPVTARMVKECLAGWRGYAKRQPPRNNLQKTAR